MVGNRPVIERLKQTGDIFMAWSDRPWILEGANVRVSMIGFDDGTQKQRMLDGVPATHINPDLTAGIDVTAIVWKFDRFARSLKQLLNALELFRELGIGFVSCTEAIDTSLPHGEMLFQIIGAIAQWERSLIVERVKAGLQHARQQGKRLGRPALLELKPDEITKLRNERKRNHVPFRELAKQFGCSLWTAHRLCGGRRG